MGNMLLDITPPDFYTGISGLSSVEMIQGYNFVDKPMYHKKEQLACAIEGNLSIGLSAHVFRQELSTGKNLNRVYMDRKEETKL